MKHVENISFPTTDNPHSSISPVPTNISASKISTDLTSLHKQVDRYAQRLKKTKNQIRDLEIELNSITPRKRARSELSKNIRKADELSKMSNKLSQSNIILKSYEALIHKYFSKYPIQKNKEDIILPQKKGNVKSLSEMKQIFKKPKPQSRQPSRLTTSRPDSSLKSKLINDKPPLPPIPTQLDYEKFYQQTKAVIKIINRFFKTTDPQTIKNILENQREKKRDLLIKSNEAETELQTFLLKKSKFETSIHNFSPIKVRDMLLITEGKVALSILTSEKEFILQIIRNYQAQKNALIMSCQYFCDLFEFPEINDLEDLKQVYVKIQKIIKKSNVISNLKYGQRSKVSFSISDLIPSSRIIEDNPSNGNKIKKNDSFEFHEKVNSIPRLSLSSARDKKNDFYPGTRSTRRAFNAFNSNSDFREIFSGRGSNDLQYFGKSLGNIFVDRYCFEIFKEKKTLSKIENNCEVASISPIFVHKVNSYSCKEILKSVSDHYIKYQDYLFLSVLCDYEIFKTEKSFMQFISIRDFLFKKLDEKIDKELAISTFDYFINSSLDVVACWFIRDIILRSKPFLNSIDKNVKFLFEKLIPSFKKRLLALSDVTEILKSTQFIGYFSCFSCFISVDIDLVKPVLSLFDEGLSKLLLIFVSSMNCSISRCGLISIFQIGKYCPQLFIHFVEFQNKATSDFLVYLKQNIQFETCVKEAAEFFNKAFYLLSKESSLFHTAMIFHCLIMQILNPIGINIEVVKALLSCLIKVVANRNKATSEQLTGLGFLQFLMKNFELEAFLASNVRKDSSREKIFQTSNKLNETKKAIITKNKASKNCKKVKSNKSICFTKLNRKVTKSTAVKKSTKNEKSGTEKKEKNTINNDTQNANNNANNDAVNENGGGAISCVSYLNIPKMKLPHLNLENPKLQLHFKPYSSINRNSLRSSISNNEYIDERRQKPIYLSKELHVVYVQLMFALLIEHNTHRLDTFFCDPFPSVNRKPNVLFVLMMHMEGKFNQEIVHPLKEAFNPSFIRKQLENQIDQDKGENGAGKKLFLVSYEKVPSFITQSNLNKTANRNETVIHNRLAQLLIDELHQYQDYMRLLRLTVPSCFDKIKYSNGYHIASGAFGAVMGITFEGNELAVKILEKSRNECDNPHLIEVYTEVSILEICKGDRRVTQLFDYGCSFDSYYIVMENYPTTLKAWRRSFLATSASISAQESQTGGIKELESSAELETEGKSSRNESEEDEGEDVEAEEEEEEEEEAEEDEDCEEKSAKNKKLVDLIMITSRKWDSSTSPQLPTLLRVYREFLNCATVLTDHHINHFDIKCDNVMLDTEGKPALGDFGESMLYNDESNCTTLLNRGTEWIKSPEMLSIALDSSAESPHFDRLRRVGAGPASDVWSIGCLFFELVTGEFLFIDTDWSRFFMRVTGSNGEEVLPQEKIEMLPPDPRYKIFIEFVLQRNVRRRPNLRQVIVKFDEMFPDAKEAPLPIIIRKKPPISPSSISSNSSSFSGSAFKL